jgi:hypothetical protein
LWKADAIQAQGRKKMNFEYSDFQQDEMIKIADFHSKDFSKQLLQAIQELAELQIEITNIELNDELNNREYENFLGELFDADFMIFQLKRMMIVGSNDLKIWKRIVKDKISRELGRHDL